ncbi:MAG: P-loop NTPase fold protein [Crocinitomicaceae bacterium]
MSLDKSKAAYTQFVQNYDEMRRYHMSEADTRSKLIDFMFLNVLGWDEKNLEREGHSESGYFDYKIAVPGFSLIVEAKKELNSFSLPINGKKSSINSLYKENKEVIDQIRGYITDHGLEFGVITNGVQYLIGRFSNHDGTIWKKNQLLIFNGLEDIENRFVEFYNNLSKISVVQSGGFEFLHSTDESSYDKIISKLIDRDKEMIRNTLSAELTQVINEIFGDIFEDAVEDDQEFIKACFVENKETKKNRDELNRLFDDTPPELSEVVKIRNLDGLASKISDEIVSIPIVAKETAPPKPIIIVGTKGAGKTTFINYLFKNKIDKKNLENHPSIYIDFIKYYNNDKTIDTERISGDILDRLYENYDYLQLYGATALKRIYYKEIQRNDAGVWEDDKKNNIAEYNRKVNNFLEQKQKNKQEHLELLSKYLIRERRLRLIIIMDNADQFNIDVQEKVFLFATSLNRSAFCGVFISLREGYYYKWRFKPPFNAFQSNVYHVTAPSYGMVLQKRISYTLERLEQEKKEDLEKTISGKNRKGYEVEMTGQAITEFFHGIKDSLFKAKNDRIIDFLNYSTFPNIREGLKLFRMFCLSGYTHMDEYILRVRFTNKNESITIPMHEFIKSIGLYNKLYYNGQYSVIPNLFYPVQDSNNHFVKIWILKFLNQKLENAGVSGKFEMFHELINYFVAFGFRINVLNKAISELLNLELIESDEILSDIKWYDLPDEDFNLSITAKGHYYVCEIINRFFYIDMVLQDTPIFEQEFFDQMMKFFPKAESNGRRNMEGRISTVEQFMMYLEKQEKNEPQALIATLGSPTGNIKANGLNNDLHRIRKSKPTETG